MNEFIVQLMAKLDISTVQADLAKLSKNLSIDIKPVLDLTATKQDISNLAKQIQASLKNQKIDVDLSNVKSAINQVVKEANSLSAKVNKIQFKVDTGTYDAQVSSLVAKTQQWTDANGNARVSTESLSAALNQLNAAYTAYNAQPTEANQQALITAEKNLQTQLTTTKNAITQCNAEWAKTSEVQSLLQRVTEFVDKNSAAMGKWGTQLKSIMATLQGGNVSTAKLKQLTTEFTNIGNAARQAGKLGESFGQKIQSAMSKFSYWTSATMIVMQSVQVIKSAITTVYDLDTALVDLQKTTTMTATELEEFYYSANETAIQMGVTTEEIIEQASAWSRLGYSSAEAATQMAALSSQFASISPGMDTDTAQEGLVSIMKAFDIDVDNVLDGIMSKINIIGNTAATSNADIVTMLEKSSSAMSEANNSLEETIALETAAVEITQDADSVGTAYKTVAMRIRGYDEETEAYTNDVEELSGEIADLTKTASTPGGISLFTDESKTEYKSTYQLLSEISEIYDDLTDADQAALLEALAGKRQGQIVAATINNFGAAEEALANMADSAGNADAEMEVIMQSLEYKVNALGQTWIGVAQNLFQRDAMKNIVDGLTSVSSAIDTVTDKLGLLGTIGVAGGLAIFIKSFS